MLVLLAMIRQQRYQWMHPTLGRSVQHLDDTRCLHLVPSEILPHRTVSIRCVFVSSNCEYCASSRLISYCSCKVAVRSEPLRYAYPLEGISAIDNTDIYEKEHSLHIPRCV